MSVDPPLPISQKRPLKEHRFHDFESLPISIRFTWFALFGCFYLLLISQIFYPIHDPGQLLISYLPPANSCRQWWSEFNQAPKDPFGQLSENFSFLPPSPIEYSVRYYDLALKKCHGRPTESWSIHGVWPSYDQHHWPQFCQKTPFNQTLLSAPLVRELKLYWFTCYAGPHQDNWSFWQHEWQKHGTCTSFSNNQSGYFWQGLELYHRLRDQSSNQTDPFSTWCSERDHGYSKRNCLIRFDLHFNQTKNN